MSSENLLVKAGIAGVALGATIFSGRTAQGANPKLLVFVHVSVKQRALQGALQKELAGIDVTAVGRIGDFERSLKDGVDAALALPVVLAAHGLSPKLHGQRKGATVETYALVGVDTPPQPTSVSTVGVLDILGREGTTKFVHRVIGGQPKIERVTKVEDLLPLLQMQRADAIMLPQRLFANVRGSSRLNLAQSELPTKVELPAVAAVGAAGPLVIAAVAKLSSSISKELGVDEWR